MAPLPKFEDFSDIEHAVRSAFKLPGMGPTTNVLPERTNLVEAPPPPSPFVDFENAVRGLPFGQQSAPPAAAAPQEMPEFAAFADASRAAIQNMRRQQIEQGEKDATAAYDSSRDVFAATPNPLADLATLGPLRRQAKAVYDADLVGGYVKDWQDESIPLWARALRGTFGVPSGAFNKMITSGIGIKPEADASIVAENVARFGEAGRDGALFDGVPGAIYDTLFTMFSDPLMLVSAPESGLSKLARGIAKEGIETGAAVAHAGVTPVEAMRGFRKGPSPGIWDTLRGKRIPDEYVDRVVAPEILRREIEKATSQTAPEIFNPKTLHEALDISTDLGASVLRPTGQLPPQVKALREVFEHTRGGGSEFPAYQAYRQQFMDMPFQSNEMLVPRSIRQSPLGRAVGFQEHLDDLGRGPTAHATFSRRLDPLWDASGAVSLDDKLKLYAQAEAQIAQGIKQGAPRLHFGGIKTPIPAPIPVLADLAGKAFAKWVDIGQHMREPLHGASVVPAGGSGHGYITGRQWDDGAGGLRDWNTAMPAGFAGGTAYDVAQSLGIPVGAEDGVSGLLKGVQTQQVGARAMLYGNKAYTNPNIIRGSSRGILTAAAPYAGAPSVSKKVFHNWLSTTLKSYNQASRGMVFDGWRSVYQLLHDTKAATPALKMDVELAALKETLDEFDKLAGGDAAMAEKFWKPLLPDVLGPAPTKAFRDMLQGQIDNFLQHHAETLDEPVTSMQGPLPANVEAPNVMLQLDQATQNAEKWMASKEGQQETQALFGALDEWLQSMVPNDVAHLNYSQIHQVQEVVGRRAAESWRMQKIFEDMQDTTLRKPMSGLELTAKLMASEGKRNPVARALKELLKAHSAPTAAALDINTLTAAEVAAQKTAMDAAVAGAQTAGRLTAQEAADLGLFLDDVATSPAAWGGYLRLMKDTSDVTNYTMAVASITKRIFEPLKQMYRRADMAGRELARKTSQDLINQLSTEQMLYVPHGPGKWKWVQAAIEKADATQRQIMRFAGVPEALGRAVRENDDSMLYADRQAGGWARDFNRDHVEGSLNEVLGLPNDTMVARNTLAELNEGFMKIAGNEGWDQFTHGDIAVQQAVRDIAQTRIKEGNDALLRVFGNDQALVDTWFANFQKRLEGVNNELFDVERIAGMVDVRRKNYIPHLLTGSFADQDRFWRWMANEEVAEWTSGSRMLASEKFAPGLTRDMRTMAEVEYYLGQVKATVKASQPITLNAAYHTTGAMAHRVLLHNRALATRKFITELQAAMPGHLLPLGLAKPGSGLAAKFEKAGFANLGNLIPTLRDWWAHGDIYNFLKSRVARNGTMLDFEGEVFGPWAFMRELQRHLKWVNTTFDIYHTKNIIALALASDTDLVRAGQIMMRAWKNRGKGVGNFRERSLAPIEAWVEGLEKDPMYQLGLRYGLAPFRGHEYQIPLVDRVMAEMHPVAGSKGAVTAMARDFRLRGGPGSKLTFDIMDQAVKQAKFEELLENGIPAHHAADMANYHLIDYSMRWMHPNIRNYAYAIFPFFAWKIGNWALHPAQFLERPGRYMIWNHLREGVTNFFVGAQTPEYYNALTEMAAGGMIIPMEDPETKNQMVLDMAMPWDSIFAPIRRIAQEDPVEWPVETLRYLAGNIWDMPYKWFVESDNQRRYQLSQEAAQQGRLEWIKQKTIGDPANEGWASSMLWGIQPWKDLGGLMVDPTKWQNWDFYMNKFLLDSFANTTQMTVSTTTGKPRRAPLSP